MAPLKISNFININSIENFQYPSNQVNSLYITNTKHERFLPHKTYATVPSLILIGWYQLTSKTWH